MDKRNESIIETPVAKKHVSEQLRQQEERKSKRW